MWATDSSKQVSISNHGKCGDTGREAGGGDARAQRRVLFQAEGREACRDLKKGKAGHEGIEGKARGQRGRQGLGRQGGCMLAGCQEQVRLPGDAGRGGKGRAGI